MPDLIEETLNPNLVYKCLCVQAVSGRTDRKLELLTGERGG